MLKKLTYTLIILLMNHTNLIAQSSSHHYDYEASSTPRSLDNNKDHKKTCFSKKNLIYVGYGICAIAVAGSLGHFLSRDTPSEPKFRTVSTHTSQKNSEFHEEVREVLCDFNQDICYSRCETTCSRFLYIDSRYKECIRQSDDDQDVLCSTQCDSGHSACLTTKKPAKELSRQDRQTQVVRCVQDQKVCGQNCVNSCNNSEKPCKEQSKCLLECDSTYVKCLDIQNKQPTSQAMKNSKSLAFIITLGVCTLFIIG